MNGDKELREAVFDIREKLATLDERIKNIREGQKEMKESLEKTSSDVSEIGLRSAVNRRDIDWNKWVVRALVLSALGLGGLELANQIGL